MLQELNLKKIYKAFDEGFLLARNFEQRFKNFDGPDSELKNVFDVINNIKGGKFSNQWRTVHAREDGFTAMPTTALHKDFNVPLYTIFNDVGLLFDGLNKSNLKFNFVSSVDLSSTYHEKNPARKAELTVYNNGNHDELVYLQDVGFGLPEKISLDVSAKKLAEMDLRGRNALNRMWELLEKEKTTSTFDIINNEVDIITNSKPLIGIVFTHNQKSPQLVGESVTSDFNKLCALAVKSYVRMRCNNDIPIVNYDSESSKPQLSHYRPSHEETLSIIENVNLYVSQSATIIEPELVKTLSAYALNNFSKGKSI